MPVYIAGLHFGGTSAASRSASVPGTSVAGTVLQWCVMREKYIVELEAPARGADYWLDATKGNGGALRRVEFVCTEHLTAQPGLDDRATLKILYLKNASRSSSP